MSREKVEWVFDHGDAEERRQAVARLRQHGQDPSPALLLRGLGDEDWRVRKEATLVVGSLAPSPRLLSALLTAFEPGDNVGLRNSVVDVLAGFGVHAIGPLASVIGELDADGRKLVVDALARGGRLEALPVLERLLADADANVRVAAVEAVAAIGDGCAEQAIGLLEKALDSADPLQQLAALDGLNRLAAIVPWESLELLFDDPVLLPAVVVAAGRSGAPDAIPVLAEQLARARGRLWQDALQSLVELASSSPPARQRAQTVLGAASATLRDRILGIVRDEDADLALRRQCLAAAAFLPGEEVARAAVAALADDDLAGDAEEVIAQLGALAVGALVSGCCASHERQRSACVELLSPFLAFDTAARTAVYKTLEDVSPLVVAAALEALAKAGDAETLEAAAERIAPSTVPIVHRAAQRALMLLAERHPQRARQMARSLTPTSPRAEAAIAVIAALGPPEGSARDADLEFLAAAASSEHASVRRAALEALSSLRDAAALGPISLALTDEENEVRLAAVRALGRLRDADGGAIGFEALSALLVRGEDAELAAAAARALGENSDPRSEPVLKAAARGAPGVAVAALEALTAFPASLRNDVVVAALAHSDVEVVKAALRALAAQGDASAVSHLAVGLDHPSRDVRRLAAELMGRIGVEAAIGPLRGRLGVETDAALRDIIARTILELEATLGRRLTAPPPSLRGGRAPR